MFNIIISLYSSKPRHWEDISWWEEIPLASQRGCNGNRQTCRGNQKVCCRCCETWGHDQIWTPEISYWPTKLNLSWHFVDKSQAKTKNVSVLILLVCSPCNYLEESRHSFLPHLPLLFSFQYGFLNDTQNSFDDGSSFSVSNVF